MFPKLRQNNDNDDGSVNVKDAMMMMTMMTMMMMRERVVTISAHVSTLPGTAATYPTIMIMMWRPCCWQICVILENLQI